jgi:hypothetical protein
MGRFELVLMLERPRRRRGVVFLLELVLEVFFTFDVLVFFIFIIFDNLGAGKLMDKGGRDGKGDGGDE